MKPDNLLDELRRECPKTAVVDGIVPLTLDELATLITNRERAAAERMRERCADAVSLHTTMTGEARGLSAEILDLELEPEEPSK